MRQLMIDCEALMENIRTVREKAGGAAVYGVLKADGYGLGLEPMARALAEGGIDRFAVTEPEAAHQILDMRLPVKEILLLRPAQTEAIGPLLRRGKVTFSVGSPEEAVALARAGLRAGMKPKAHVQIDTGLGRYGFRWDDPQRLRFLYESFTALRFTGIYTHFDGGAKQARRQAARFRSVLASLAEAEIDPGMRHACASRALFGGPDLRLDGVRVGSAFLGRVPGGEKYGLRDVCRCGAEITAVRTLRAGDTVSYGVRFRADRNMRAAVVELGTVHGLGLEPVCGRKSLAAAAAEWLRQTRNTLRVSRLGAEIGGKWAPVLGRVCTECVILDVTEIDCAPGDTAVFSLNPLFCRDMERVWLNLPLDEGTARPVA